MGNHMTCFQSGHGKQEQIDRHLRALKLVITSFKPTVLLVPTDHHAKSLSINFFPLSALLS